MDNIDRFPSVSWPSLNGTKGGKHRRVSLCKFVVFEWNESGKIDGLRCVS